MIEVVTLRLSVSVAVAPAATVPTFHVTVPFAPTAGALVAAGDADANVIPAGIGSLTTTPVTGSVADGLRYWSVYVSVSPVAATSSLLGIFVSDMPIGILQTVPLLANAPAAPL